MDGEGASHACHLTFFLSPSFEQGRVELDEDLLSNSRKATETLVCVGMRIGKAAAR